MTAADGTKIAERWAITYRIQRDMTRSFRNEPDTVATAQRTMKLIKELSAAEERERVLVEADDSVLSQAHLALCWVQEKMPQFYPDMIRRIKKQCGSALDEYEARAALAAPAQPQTGGSK